MYLSVYNNPLSSVQVYAITYIHGLLATADYHWNIQLATWMLVQVYLGVYNNPLSPVQVYAQI